MCFFIWMIRNGDFSMMYKNIYFRLKFRFNWHKHMYGKPTICNLIMFIGKIVFFMSLCYSTGKWKTQAGERGFKRCWVNMWTSEKNTQFAGKKNFSRATKKVTSPSSAKSKDKYIYGDGSKPITIFWGINFHSQLIFRVPRVPGFWRRAI